MEVSTKRSIYVAFSFAAIIVLISASILCMNLIPAYAIPYDGTKPMVTLSWDHGFLTQYKPMLQACKMNVIGTIYAGTIRSANPNFMNWTQLHTLGNCGFELASHSRAHAVETKGLSSLQLRSEIYGSKQDLIKQGFNVYGFVPPIGATNQTVISGYIKPNYQYTMFATPALNNKTTIANTQKTYGITILAGYTLGDLNPLALGQINSYQQFLNTLQIAISHKYWLIVHVHDILPDGTTNFKNYQGPTSQSFFNATLNTIHQYQQNGTIIVEPQCKGLGLC